jgi:peptidyl-prolyl cis-trans isomerase C
VASWHWFREPLLHFFLFGGIVFGAYAWLQEDAPAVQDDGNHIVIDQAELDHLTGLWKLQWKRDPAPDDVAAIIDRHLRQEVFYREALKMGLDHNDGIIRKRLAQKMEAVANDLSVLMKPPTEARLREYFHSREAFFTLPQAYAFRQVLFLPDEPQVEERMQATLSALRQGAPVPGERQNKLSLPVEWPMTAQNELHNDFGGDFAEALAALPVGHWAGPVRSGFGWHLVLVEERQAPRLPAFEEVRDYVTREYEYQSVLEAQDEVYQNLLAKYEVTITADVPQSAVKVGLSAK